MHLSATKHPRKTNWFNHQLLAAFVLTILLPDPRLRATTYTWDGGGSNSNLGTANNWNPNGAPTRTATTNDFHFAGSTKLSPVTNTGAWTIHSITFDSGAGAFNIGTSNGITLGASGVNSIINNSTNLETISVGLTLSGGAQSWSANSGDLTFGSTVNNGGFLLTLNGGNDFNFNGVISGTGGLTVNDSGGLVTLAATNTFTGPVTLTGGTLSVGTINNGGTAGNLGKATNAASNLVFDGGTLQYTGSTASTNRSFTINNGKTATIEVTANTLTMSGAASGGTGALTKTGAGTLILSGNNSYTGATAVNAGTLQLNGTISSAAVNVNGGALNINSNNRIIDTAAVTIAGGTLGLGAHTDTVGSLTMSSGTLGGTGTLTAA
ncbi:MAG TPA: autotransporter-associated beta strand repeat-containing protein, partial [Opitutus sp.]|nr:autotransporter-associated beta strand repeat-containing protein [Opitutus sp.]